MLAMLIQEVIGAGCGSGVFQRASAAQAVLGPTSAGHWPRQHIQHLASVETMFGKVVTAQEQQGSRGKWQIIAVLLLCDW